MRPLPVPRALLAGVFTLTLAMYWFTLCPTVHWDDSGELITAAYVLGIPHPPGEPLYTMLGWVFTHLPGLPSPAYGMNLMSAMFGALTWTMAAGWLVQILHTRGTPAPGAVAAAGLAALTGAVGDIAWYQSVIAENTTLHTTFVAGLLWWAWRLGTGPRRADGPLLRHMLGWAFIYGLSASNHPAGVFLFPAFVGWFLYTQGRRLLRPHWIVGMLACAVAGLLPYAYLVLASRANPPLDWGNPETWPNFRWVVTTQQYASDALRAPTLTDAWRGSWILTRAIGTEWGVLGAAVLSAGWIRLAVHSRALAVWPLLVLPVFVYLSANPAYIGAYLMPVFLFFMPALGTGFAGALTVCARRGHWAFAAAVSVAAFVPGTAMAMHWQTHNLRRDDLAKRYAEFVIGALPADAILVTESAPLQFIGLYLTYCEQFRPDVILITANGLRRPGYVQTLRRNYPRLHWPDTFDLTPELGSASVAPLQLSARNPPWTRDLLLALYDANGEHHRMYWENIASYGPILTEFAQQGYVYELRRGLSGGRVPAWSGTDAGPGGFMLPPPWDSRVENSPGARVAYASTLFTVAIAWGLEGRSELVAEALADCARLAPANPAYHTNLGIALATLERYADAEIAMLEAIRLRPTNGHYAANLGALYRSTGRHPEALVWMDRALHTWKTAPWDFLVTAADLAVEFGRLDIAYRALHRAAEVRPTHVPTLYNLTTVTIRAGDLVEASAVVDRTLALAPQAAESWFHAAWLGAERDDDVRTIRTALAEAYARNPEWTRRRAMQHPVLAPLMTQFPSSAEPDGTP